MNKTEAKILHGLYYHQELVGKEIKYQAQELNWLANTPISKGRDWSDNDGKLKTFEDEKEDFLATICAGSASAQRPLAYLQASGYITYKKEGEFFRIAVTGAGADMARELDTFGGRLNILYKQHKDGVIWFIATVLVSLITTLITKSC